MLRQLLLKYRRILVVGIQVTLAAVANLLAFWLRFDGDVPRWAMDAALQTLPWLLACRVLMLIPFRLHDGLWRYTSLWDVRNIIAGVVTSSIVFAAVVRLGLGLTAYPRSIFIIDAVLLIGLLIGVRLPRRIYRELRTGAREKRILIFGAGDAGELIVRDMKNNPYYSYEPIGFVDDDISKVGQRIHGVPVLGGRSQLTSIVEAYRPHEILVAIPRADAADIRGVVRALEPFKIPIKTLPNLRDLIDGKVQVTSIRNLAVQDLLPRAPVGLDPRPLHALLSDKVVLVTGAGGSIGSELSRQIAALRPTKLVLYERYENALHAITNDLEDQGYRAVVRAVIGDVTDRDRLNAVMAQHKPHVVFHAAAHKHVPMMEENPAEAVKNNVLGTRMVAEAAMRHGVERMILISTDKAVRPASVMGATKRVAELIVQSAADTTRTVFVTVRFGNVLGSNGSVVPRFMEQIRTGGPVTVTHPGMRRYFMLIDEAVQLVLHAGASGGQGGIYVLDMGEQISLVDLARDLIRLSGYVPDEDIRIEFIGQRQGEKLTEELVSDDEIVEPSSTEKVLHVRPGRDVNRTELLAQIARLEELAIQGDEPGVIRQLTCIVPHFPTLPVAAEAVSQPPPIEPRPAYPPSGLQPVAAAAENP